MEPIFRIANQKDAATITSLVLALTREITELSKTAKFTINHEQTLATCEKLLAAGQYGGVIVESCGQAIGLATFAETYALYAGGKLGVLQEFYIAPEYRSQGLGARLMEQVKAVGAQRDWVCIELCTPPLPTFERSLSFYQSQGLQPVGGRKMRMYL